MTSPIRSQSDDIDYDFYGEHNNHKRELEESQADERPNGGVSIEECSEQLSASIQNSVASPTGVPTENQNEKRHAISSRDPRCRKRANENDAAPSTRATDPGENGANGTGKGSQTDDTQTEDNDANAADDEDVLDIFGDDDYFDTQSEVGEPQPKKARIEVEPNRTSKNAPEARESVPLAKSAIEPATRTVVSQGSFKIPKLCAPQVTIKNDYVTKQLQSQPQSLPLTRTLFVPKQTADGSKQMTERIPIKQRIGFLKGMDPSQLTQSLTRSNANTNRSVSSKSVAAPKPSSGPDPESQKRVLLAYKSSQELQNKINKTNANVTAVLPSRSVSVKEYALPSFAMNPLENEPPFNVLFRNVCRRFIDGKCPVPPITCRFNHTMPDSEFVRNKLDQFGSKNAIQLFEVFLLRSKKLFTLYMSVFCDYFGVHKLETLLEEMVLHCCDPDRRMWSHLTHVVDGLLKMGLAFHVALRKLFMLIPRRTIQANNAVLKLMLDDRNTRLELFFNIMKSLANQANFVYPIEAVNRILHIFVTKPDHGEELMMLIWQILTKIPTSQQSRIDNELLVQFMSKTSSTAGKVVGSVAATTPAEH